MRGLCSKCWKGQARIEEGKSPFPPLEVEPSEIGGNPALFTHGNFDYQTYRECPFRDIAVVKMPPLCQVGFTLLVLLGPRVEESWVERSVTSGQLSCQTNSNHSGRDRFEECGN